MVINTLIVRIRTWLDAQNPASLLMRVPPAAIAKWCLTNLTSNREGLLSFSLFWFWFPVADMIYKGNRDLEEV